MLQFIQLGEAPWEKGPNQRFFLSFISCCCQITCVLMQPDVAKYLVNIASLGLVLIEHAREKVFDRSTQMRCLCVSLQVKLFVAYLMVPERSIIIPVGLSAREQKIQYTSKTPDVNTGSVVLAHENLWRDVARGTDLETGGVLR